MSSELSIITEDLSYAAADVADALHDEGIDHPVVASLSNSLGDHAAASIEQLSQK